MTAANGRKSIFITGGASGIGLAAAKRFAKEGWFVGLSDIDAGGLKLAQGVLGAGNCSTHKLDVRDRKAWDKALAEFAKASGGRLDVLLNNAGIRCRKAFGSYTRADFATVVSVNLAAAFFASQAVLPAMRAQGGGRIIHVASQMGSVAAEENALYGLTKAALIHLTRNMAFELAKEGIQVNSVSPGPIATQFNLDTWGRMPGKLETMVGRVPAGRMGEAREVAEAIVFLATAEGSYIQGHDLVVDGGYIIH